MSTEILEKWFGCYKSSYYSVLGLSSVDGEITTELQSDQWATYETWVALKYTGIYIEEELKLIQVW